MNSPLLIAFVGPNGAGKSTLRHLLFEKSSVPFINADAIAVEFGIGAYQAAEIAEERRVSLLEAGLSFMFESVLSDPVGAKVAFLTKARAAGYKVVVHFIGIPSPEFSRARVAQRVIEGGHDVPDEKIDGRYPRVLENLRRLIGQVDDLTIYDNTSAETPYRVLARFLDDRLVELATELPTWIDYLDLSSHTTTETAHLP